MVTASIKKVCGTTSTLNEGGNVDVEPTTEMTDAQKLERVIEILNNMDIVPELKVEILRSIVVK